MSKQLVLAGQIPLRVMRDLFSSRAADLGPDDHGTHGIRPLYRIILLLIVVRVATRPLKNMRSPYVFVIFLFFTRSILQPLLFHQPQDWLFY